jgi:hypothetical protein
MYIELFRDQDQLIHTAIVKDSGDSLSIKTFGVGAADAAQRFAERLGDVLLSPWFWREGHADGYKPPKE